MMPAPAPSPAPFPPPAASGVASAARPPLGSPRSVSPSSVCVCHGRAKDVRHRCRAPAASPPSSSPGCPCPRDRRADADELTAVRWILCWWPQVRRRRVYQGIVCAWELRFAPLRRAPSRGAVPLRHCSRTSPRRSLLEAERPDSRGQGKDRKVVEEEDNGEQHRSDRRRGAAPHGRGGPSTQSGV